MPLWVSLYLAGYVTYSIWAHVDDFKKIGVSFWVVFEVVGNVCLFLPAFAWWHPQAYFIFGRFIIFIFAIGLISMVVFVCKGVRSNSSDPDLSLFESVVLSSFGAALLLLVVSPLVWWGWQGICEHL